MKKVLTFLIACWLCIFCGACFVHSISSFKYVGDTAYHSVPIRTIPVYVDVAFGAADKVAIDDALNQWNYALNGYVRLELVSTNFDMEPEIIRQCLNGGCWMIMKVNSNSNFIPDDPAHPLNKTLAWANDIGGNRIYFVRDRIQNEWMTGVALHEMGHLLGAPHDEIYLMAPQFNWENSRCVDYSAVMLVADYWHIPRSGVKYCIYTN